MPRPTVAPITERFDWSIKIPTQVHFSNKNIENSHKAILKKRKMTSDIGKHPKRRKRENINVTSGEMIVFFVFYWNKGHAFLIFCIKIQIKPFRTILVLGISRQRSPRNHHVTERRSRTVSTKVKPGIHGRKPIFLWPNTDHRKWLKYSFPFVHSWIAIWSDST